MPGRDHLFISYAIEDSTLADWLVRRLAALGYAVWYDRFKLLGGEPWPQDIEAAIEGRTFRMLALFSHASKEKRNPTGERKKADAVGAREGIRDFVIPLNIDLSAADVPWDLSATQYIDFSKSWAAGLAGILAKLDKLNAPKPLSNGAELVRETTIDRTALQSTTELLASNCLRVLQLPRRVFRVTLQDNFGSAEREQLRESWAFRSTGEGPVLAFTEPPDHFDRQMIERIEETDCGGQTEVFGQNTRDVVVSLIHASIDSRFRSAGFVRDPHGWHIPHDCKPNNRLSFQLIEGGRTWVKTSGERHFGRGRARRPYRYFLGATCRVLRSDSLDDLMLLLKPRVHLTTRTGESFGKRGGVARRKHLCKNWWNNEWLARTLAIVQALWTESDLIRIGDLSIEGWPCLLESPVSIDESKTDKPDDAAMHGSGESDDETDHAEA